MLPMVRQERGNTSSPSGLHAAWRRVEMMSTTRQQSEHTAQGRGHRATPGPVSQRVVERWRDRAAGRWQPQAGPRDCKARPCRVGRMQGPLLAQGAG